MENKGLFPQRWYGELLEEIQRFKEEERAMSKGVTVKNAVLIGITFVAVLALILGMGVVDNTGSLMAGYPLILPSLGWLVLFVYVNRDTL